MVTVTFGCEQISFQAILIFEDDLIPLKTKTEF